MDKDKLTGDAMREIIRNEHLNQLAKSEQQRHRYAAEVKQARIREERARPFNELQTRNRQVIHAVQEVTAPAEEIDYYGRNRKKIFVVIGKHTQTERTPDHVSVCGVTYIDNHPNSVYSTGAATAEFAFAVIPRGLIDHFIQDPHDLHNPERRDVFSFSSRRIFIR